MPSRRTGRRGWSLSALARETGLSKTLVSTLESSEGNPSLETMPPLGFLVDVHAVAHLA